MRKMNRLIRSGGHMSLAKFELIIVAPWRKRTERESLKCDRQNGMGKMNRLTHSGGHMSLDKFEFIIVAPWEEQTE